MEGTGHFDYDKGTYMVEGAEHEKPLENFLFNNRYFTCVYHTGNGYSKYINFDGHSTGVVEGSTEPGFLQNTRIIYIRDDETGVFWSAGYYPVCLDYDLYKCVHGHAGTVIENKTNGIKSTWRLFVPEGNDPVELWTLNLENTGTGKRKLSVFAAVELSLKCDVDLYGHETYLSALYIENINAVIAKKAPMNLPHDYFCAFITSMAPVLSWDTRMDSFTGKFRTLGAPNAVIRGKCGSSVSSRDRICGVLHHSCTVKPGNGARFDYLAGAADVFNIETCVKEYRTKYLSNVANKIDSRYDKLTEKYNINLDKRKIECEDKNLNMLFNYWIPRLTGLGTTACRWGTLGYRDILQHAQGGIVTGYKEISRERIKQSLGHQLSGGYSVRSFPPVHADAALYLNTWKEL